MNDQSVVEIIENDHRSVAALLDQLASGAQSEAVKRELVQSLAQHSVAEEILIYPLVGEQAPDGEALETESRREHQAIKEALLRFDKTGFDDEGFGDTLRELKTAVESHVAEEESEVLPALSRTLDDSRQRELAEQFVEQKAKAPTRPHPGAPDSPGAEKVVGAMAAPVDRLRDKVEDR